MADNQGYAFSFTVTGQAADTFGVVAFNGQEAVNEPYRFDITLASQNKSISPDDVVQKRGRLQLKGPSQTLTASGLVQSFTQVRFVKNLAIYRATLVPPMANLQFYQQNQVFLDKALPDIIQQLLKDGKISQSELRLKENYPTWEYICQFNESHLDFITRWLEQRGAYYFFEQSDSEEKLVIVDSSMAHNSCLSDKLLYSPPSNLDDPQRELLVKSLVVEHSTVPATVLLKDYNFQYPTLDMKAQAQVSAKGVGQHYIYGDSFLTQSDGENLAKIRAQELAWKEAVYHGESLCPALRPGFTFQLSDHYDPSCNGEYLLLKVKHQARNHVYLADGVGKDGHHAEATPVYTNTFTAIPSDIQYRPPRLTPKPRYPGLLTATVDAESSGQYAELDDQGRYKIRLPFDLAGKPSGKASCWIRMAQPYAGANYGMHLPLLKGAEVLISFVEADPDRPVITAAIPNTNNISVVQDKIQPMNLVQSASGNQLMMGDKQNATFVGLYHPKSTSGIFLGELDEEGTKGSLAATEGGDYKVAFESKASLSLGTSNEVVVGLKNEGTLGGTFETNLGFKGELNISDTVEYVRGNRFEFGTYGYVMEETRHYIANKSFALRAGLPASISSLEKNGLTSVAAMASSTFAGAASITGLKELFSSDGLWKHSGLTAKIAGGIYSSYLGVEAIEGLYAHSQNLRSMGKKIDKAAHDNSVAAMDAGTSGIQMKVDTTQTHGASPTFTLNVGAASAEQKTSMSITDSGKNFSLNNVNKMMLQMGQGHYITLGTNDQGATKSEVAIQEKKLDLETAKAKINISSQGSAAINAAVTNGASLSIQSGAAVLAGPENKAQIRYGRGRMDIKGTMIFMRGSTGVQIKASGMVKLQ